MTTENEVQPIEEEPAQVQGELFDIGALEVPQPFILPSEERMQDIALVAIGKIPLQDLINDAVSALIEVYKAKPEICQLDIGNYDNYPPLVANPFMDLVAYLRELHRRREH
jgi:hypothetical protein